MHTPEFSTLGTALSFWVACGSACHPASFQMHRCLIDIDEDYDPLTGRLSKEVVLVL